MKVFQELKSGVTVELAKAIQDSPCLYDSRDANYRQKECRQRAWKRISKAAGIPEQRCQVLWKALRDKYVRGRKKELTANKLGLPQQGARDTWSLKGALDFLEPHVRSRTHGSDGDDNELMMRRLPSLEPPSFVFTNVRHVPESQALDDTTSLHDNEPQAKIPRRGNSVLEKGLQAFVDGNSEGNKADMLFGLSVAAELEGMSEDKKKSVKLEILKIIYS